MKSLLALIWVFAMGASEARAEPELVRVQPAVKVEAPPPSSGDLIDLFGQEAAPGDRAQAAIPEAQRTLRRPEGQTAPIRKSSGDARVIDRRSPISSAWRWTDALPLAAVLGVIALVAIVLKRFLPARSLIGQAPGLLEVVARTPVSPKQSILLVRIGRRFLLLGVSPDRIATLCTIEDAESAAELLGEVASRQPDSSSRAFQNSFRLEEAQFEEDEERDSALSAGGHVRGLLEKIRQMKGSRVA